MPGNIDYHQFFTHLKNVFIMGGEINYSATDACYVIHVESADAQQITSLDSKRYTHTTHHMVDAINAFVVGGCNDDRYIKVCLKFDISNQKFFEIGELIKAR